MLQAAALLQVATAAAAGVDSLPPDPFEMPGERFVMTRDELVLHHINTVEDILRLCPGILFMREGPPAAPVAVTVDGLGAGAVALLIDGEPFRDIYTFESLAGFVPLSRISRVEVLYSGLTLRAADLYAAAAVNVVTEQRGGEGPTASAEFTYGKHNMRARRIGFATPSSYIGGSISYDQYLQDPLDRVLVGDNRALVGGYDGRSVLAVFYVVDAEGGGLDVSLHTYEDAYTGTALSPRDEIRREGLGTRIGYRRGGFEAAIRQRMLEASRSYGNVEGWSTSGAVTLVTEFAGSRIFAFLSGERALFERTINRLVEETFYQIVGGETLNVYTDTVIRPYVLDPDAYTRLEGGVLVGREIGAGITGRIGLFGGRHDAAGGYAGWEGALSRVAGGFHQRISLSRRLRLPSAAELFQDEPDSSWTGAYPGTAGDPGLGPELVDGIDLSLGFPGPLSVALFVRRCGDAITTDEDGARYLNGGAQRTAGGRARFLRSWKLVGFDISVTADLLLFGERPDGGVGLPRYFARGGLEIGRPVFKSTERVAVRWASEACGEREWHGAALGPYDLHDVSLSVTVLGAVLRGQLRNVLDREYETVPNYRMPGRHWSIGLYWEFFD